MADGPVDVAEIHAPYAHQEIIVREALGLDDSVTINPSGGPLAANPIMSAGLIRIGEAADPGLLGPGPAGGGPRHLGPVPATEPRLRPGGCVMAERCAVIGVGQTHHKAKRDDVSIAGLVREAAKMALADADLTWSDIDAVVIGKAPDMFEGNMMPELYLAPALGAVGKPMIRVHTAGSVGGSTALVAAHLIKSGIHKRVLTVAYEKQSDSDAMWALSVPQPFAAPLLAGAGGYFAPHIRAYMRRSGAPEHIGRMVAVKDRQNAMRNPYAHLHLADIDMKMVEDSMMLWDPLRYLEACPSSDGAAAMVLAAEDAVSGQYPAGVGPRHGHAVRADHVRRTRPGQPAGRPRLLGRRLRPGRHHRPPRADRRGRGVRALQLVRADVAGEPRLLRPGRRLEADRVGGHRLRRGHPVEHLGRRAVVQPDRCVGDAPVPRGGHAGAGPGRRAPGRRGQGGPGPGLRRRVAVLLHVGGRERQALTGAGRGAPRPAPCRDPGRR